MAGVSPFQAAVGRVGQFHRSALSIDAAFPRSCFFRQYDIPILTTVIGLVHFLVASVSIGLPSIGSPTQILSPRIELAKLSEPERSTQPPSY